MKDNAGDRRGELVQKVYERNKVHITQLAELYKVKEPMIAAAAPVQLLHAQGGHDIDAAHNEQGTQMAQDDDVADSPPIDIDLSLQKAIAACIEAEDKLDAAAHELDNATVEADAGGAEEGGGRDELRSKKQRHGWHINLSCSRYWFVKYNRSWQLRPT